MHHITQKLLINQSIFYTWIFFVLSFSVALLTAIRKIAVGEPSRKSCLNDSRVHSLLHCVQSAYWLDWLRHCPPSRKRHCQFYLQVCMLLTKKIFKKTFFSQVSQTWKWFISLFSNLGPKSTSLPHRMTNSFGKLRQLKLKKRFALNFWQSHHKIYIFTVHIFLNLY